MFCLQSTDKGLPKSITISVHDLVLELESVKCESFNSKLTCSFCFSKKCLVVLLVTDKRKKKPHNTKQVWAIMNLYATWLLFWLFSPSQWYNNEIENPQRASQHLLVHSLSAVHWREKVCKLLTLLKINLSVAAQPAHFPSSQKHLPPSLPKLPIYPVSCWKVSLDAF